jgi:hypothetical protein
VDVDLHCVVAVGGRSGHARADLAAERRVERHFPAHDDLLQLLQPVGQRGVAAHLGLGRGKVAERLGRQGDAGPQDDAVGERIAAGDPVQEQDFPEETAGQTDR